MTTSGVFGNLFAKLCFDELDFENLVLIKSGFVVTDLCLDTLLLKVVLVE